MLNPLSLELNIHQRILSELASKSDSIRPNSPSEKELIASKVHTRDVESGDDEVPGSPPTIAYMVSCSMVPIRNTYSTFRQSASRVHCNIAFGEMVVNFPTVQLDKSIEPMMSALLDILRDVPFIDFDPSLSWHGTQSLLLLRIYSIIPSDRLGLA